jgi:hypothetical protein
MEINIAAEGERLYRKLLSEISACNWPAVEAMFAPGFQSVHSDGARDRATEIQMIKNEKIGKCTVSDFKVTQADDCLVVTNMLAVEETIDGKRLPAKSFARLSVWQQNQGTWQMISIANLRSL